MIDTITVVFDQELESLRLQARSLDLYVNNINRVFVIVNEDSDLSQHINKDWWGRWKNHLEIINRNHFDCTWHDNGWLSQQVLKLLTASQASSPWSVILDAKTFFTREFLPMSHRPCVGQLPIYPIFEPSRQIVNKLFGINLQNQLGPGGVPFIINTAQVQQMIEWIEQKTNQKFSEWFQQQGVLTEFILYSGWILFNTGSLDSIYETNKNQIFACNLCHSEVNLFDQKFEFMPNSLTVSIHRKAWTQLTQQQQTLYLDFLSSRGIS